MKLKYFLEPRWMQGNGLLNHGEVIPPTATNQAIADLANAAVESGDLRCAFDFEGDLPSDWIAAVKGMLERPHENREQQAVDILVEVLLMLEDKGRSVPCPEKSDPPKRKKRNGINGRI